MSNQVMYSSVPNKSLGTFIVFSSSVQGVQGGTFIVFSENVLGVRLLGRGTFIPFFFLAVRYFLNRVTLQKKIPL